MAEIKVIQSIKEGYAALASNPIVFAPAFGYAIVSILLQQKTQAVINSVGAPRTLTLISLLILYPLVGMFASGMMINLLATSKKTTLGESAKFTADRFPTLLMAIILFFAGSTAAYAAIFYLSGVLTVFLLALALPLSYIMVRVAFFSYAIIIDRQGAIDSLKKSWALTEGQFWNIIGLVLLQLIVVLPLLLINLAMQHYQIALPDILIGLLNALITTVTIAWIVSPMTRAYMQLKE